MPDLAIDAAGNIYGFGFFEGQADLDPTVRQAALVLVGRRGVVRQ